jgi:RNA polymerase sigma-70 factor (ECF subfamily)
MTAPPARWKIVPCITIVSESAVGRASRERTSAVTRIRDMRPSDDQLLEAIRAGSRPAWGQLFARHADSAWRTAFAIVHDHGRAEDVVQDAFVRAIHAAERFDRSRPFRPWLLRIVTNRALDVLRHEQYATPGDVEPSGALDGVADRDAADVREAILRLDPDRRAVVVLRYWLDLSPVEIADRLGLPVGTVGSRLTRALHELAGYLEVAGNA